MANKIRSRRAGRFDERDKGKWQPPPSPPQTYCVQCWLRRGATRQMVWIPEEHAVIGRFLRLTKFGVSEDGWEVVGVGARQPEEPEFHGR